MGNRSVAEALRALTEDNERPELARLRDIFDEVEAAFEAGASRAKVLDVLHEEGFTMSLKTFANALYRIRKERANGKTHRAPSPVAKTSTTTIPAETVTPAQDNVSQDQEPKPEEEFVDFLNPGKREEKANRYVSSNSLFKRNRPKEQK